MQKFQQQRSTRDVKPELFDLVQDISDYFSDLKKKGQYAVQISDTCTSMIENWGKEPIGEPYLYCQGPENASICFIDSESTLFKGNEGALLVKIIKAMNLDPAKIFICNADNSLKVKQKMDHMHPRVIITLGEKAAQIFNKEKKRLDVCHGQYFDYNGIKVMPTFHPALLLRRPEFKRQVWQAMQQVMKTAGL